MLHLESTDLFEEVFFSSKTITDKKSINKNIKLDIVYTFVDANDNTWKVKYFKHNKKLDNGRYDDSHILFSLKTLEKYFPLDLINKIYLVSDYHRIDLKELKFIKNKIVWIDHEDIIPKEYLPTFNSMVIEAFLWNIPNLDSNFLYFNDDLIIGNYINKNDFFTENNTPIQFFGKYTKSSHPWYKNIQSSNRLFEKKFGINPQLYPNHAAYHILTEQYKNVYNIFKSDLEYMFNNHKSRQYDNYSHNLIFLYGMYADYKKLVKNGTISFSHIFNFHDSFIEKTKSINNRKKFYAISSKIKNDQINNFHQFQQNLLLDN